MKTKFLAEMAAAGLPTELPPSPPVTEDDLAALPAAVGRYLRFMRVVGRPRDASFRAGGRGRFKMRPEAAWLPMEFWQYDARSEVTRIFHMSLRMFGVVPVHVRDTYRKGRGRMRARAFDLVSVVDEARDELDIGELVTYLNDAVLLAPSMLLVPAVTFAAVDDGAFDVTLRDSGRSVTARVFLDERGAVRNFSTTDRFYQDPADPKKAWVRTRWTTPIDGWTEVGGRPLPTQGRAVWQLAGGEYAYAEMDFSRSDIAFNVPPGV